MNKRINPLLAFLSIITFILLGFLYFKYKNTQQVTTRLPLSNTPITPAKSINLNSLINNSLFEEKKIIENNEYTKIDVVYPFFKNADQSYNEAISLFLQNNIKEHKQISEENWKARVETQMPGENIPQVPKDEDKLYYYSKFEPVQVNDTYISGLLTYGGYEGGAHGLDSLVSYNYDVKNKKEITIQDFILQNKIDFNIIQKEVREKLKEQYTKDAEPGEYTDNIIKDINAGTEKQDDFSVFTFSGKKVKFYFNHYQVGPYVFGMPEVDVTLP